MYGGSLLTCFHTSIMYGVICEAGSKNVSSSCVHRVHASVQVHRDWISLCSSVVEVSRRSGVAPRP